MSLEWKSERKTGVIVASLVATLSLGAIVIAASTGPLHPEPNSLDVKHPHFISNSGPMKHGPHPNPWMIRVTGWMVSVASRLS